ncbi:MAG TPA: trypsin-like peptidase domain-containing protein [Trebonia sp.]|nr:trypsin-like peptidase domain-containing protein [Trebonia sp.]
MGREPAGAEGEETPPPAVRGSRRLIAAGLAGGIVLLLAIAVLATRLASTPAPATASAAAGPSPTPTATLTVPAIYQRVAPSVVTIRAGRNLGTGVIVADNGTIVTADHVIAGARSITVYFADGTVASASVISADKQTDIAEVSPAKLPQPVVPATLGGTADVGASVVAIGNPLGLTDSVSSGVVSGLDRTADTDTGTRSGLIQFDASVNPGSSGGPLLDDRGMVVGIVVAIAEPDGQDAFAGIGFAVPIGAALGGGSGGGGPGKGPQI